MVGASGACRRPAPLSGWGPPRRGPLRSAALIAAALATTALSACGRGGTERGAVERTDRTAPSAAAPAEPGPGEARPAAADSEHAGPAPRTPTVASPVPPAVEAVCAAVAAWWRRDALATVRVADSAAATPMGETVEGCVVVARQAHAPTADSAASGEEIAATQTPGHTLGRASGKGWIELLRYMADGPDGSSSAFQRGPVRCSVAVSWDGGDDSDPSYVPEDWLEEVTICWWEPAGVAASDTAP